MKSLLIDTNILLLLIVGAASEAYIGKHKRTGEFSRRSFGQLKSIVVQFPKVEAPPHVLAEVSSLLKNTNDQGMLRELREKLKLFIEADSELLVASLNGARSNIYSWTGLTDSVLFELSKSKDRTLVTMDSDLFNAASSFRDGHINFRHLMAI
jgi:hypothetical protein